MKTTAAEPHHMTEAETADLWARADAAISRTLQNRARTESPSRPLTNDDLPWARPLWNRLPAHVKEGVISVRVPVAGARILLLKGGEGVRRASFGSRDQAVRRSAFL